MTQLTVSRPQADERIRGQVEKGLALRDAEIGSESHLKQIKAAYFTWDEYNVELLKKLFQTENESQTYGASKGFFSLGESSLGERIAEFRDDVSSRIRRLESVLERLELFDEPPSSDASSKE
jgi:hypothetical protein